MSQDFNQMNNIKFNPNLPSNMLIADQSNEVDEEVVISDDFPMIVWLRGDEDYCTEFCIDADEAMNLLSIKRSRLTQLSGKEIRVGRRRVGRYVKPFYRQVDIDSYLKWTRSSATSSKSKAALLEAEQILEKSVQKMQEGVLEQLTELREMFDLKLGQRLSETTQINESILKNQLEKMFQTYQNVLMAVEQSSRSLFSQIPSGEMIQKIVKNNVQDIANTSNALKGILENINQEQAVAKAQREDLASILSTLSASFTVLNNKKTEPSSFFLLKPNLKKHS